MSPIDLPKLVSEIIIETLVVVQKAIVVPGGFAAEKQTTEPAIPRIAAEAEGFVAVLEAAVATAVAAAVEFVVATVAAEAAVASVAVVESVAVVIVVVVVVVVPVPAPGLELVEEVVGVVTAEQLQVVHFVE